MKRILIFFTVLLFISCEDEKDDASNSNLVGTWNLSNMGEYEDAANCSGTIDYTGWAFAQAFGMTGTLEFKSGGTGTYTISALGMNESTQITWTEGKNEFCIEGFCIPIKIEDNKLSYEIKDDAACEDSEGNITSHSSESSCTNAGNDWYEATCTISEFTKQ